HGLWSDLMRVGVTSFVGLLSGLLLALAGCGQAEKSDQIPSSRTSTAPSGPCPTILLAQAQFIETTDPETGETKSTPGAARLEILRQVGDEWTPEVIEDPESNVFHKAVLFEDPENPDTPPGILTIGANAAALKLWRKSDDGWTAETLWTTTFGGKHNRLRDFEIGDVTGDGKLDFAVVTHDQGVVAVLSRGEAGWETTEIDRKERTFVHECELGDLDRDGVLEIYATPSKPNKFDGTPQPGEIVVYRHTAAGFERAVVDEFPLRHVKEILAMQIDDSGPVLLAAVEAELGERPDAPLDAKKTLIKRYRFENGQYVGDVVCTLPDHLCRFLNVGDIDGDGKPELIASTHKKGIWLARPGAKEWAAELVDADSAGFEHATALADLDGDGVQEIYVAADQQREVRRYRWDGSDWQRDTLSSTDGRKITFGITAGQM
ncbi:MAG: VCBS repeat-containing protein, partial [Planctomycetes bacterium]|nr:VCBS repeat-containing protein [Planctomycetota bacterium]